MTNRERIASTLSNFEGEDPFYVADLIIYDVSRALMGEECVAKMAQRLALADAYSETMQGDSEWREDAKDTLAELLDTAFGADDDGGER